MSFFFFPCILKGQHGNGPKLPAWSSWSFASFAINDLQSNTVICNKIINFSFEKRIELFMCVFLLLYKISLSD